MISYFSQLKGKVILDSQGVRIGKLDDIAIKDGEKFAEATYLILVKDKNKVKIPWEMVETYNGTIKLAHKLHDIRLAPLESSDILLRETILDRQLIDINGLKVVRVNDILLAPVHGKLSVISVDAGMHGFFRRLGFSTKTVKEGQMIPLEYVEPVHVHSSLRLKIPRSRVSSLHPADIADLLSELPPKERANIFGRLDDEVAADTLAETQPDVTKSVIAGTKEKKIAQVLERMAPDEAADVLSELNSQKANEIVRLLNPDFAHQVQGLLGYEEQSAGRIMNPEFIAVYQDNTAQQAIEYLRQRSPVADRSYYVYVLDSEQRLLGVLSLRELIISPPQRKVAEFMKTNVIKVSDKATKDEAARLVVKFNLSVLPVVSENDTLLGVIAADDIMTGLFAKNLKRIAPKRKYYLHKKRKNGTNKPASS